MRRDWTSEENDFLIANYQTLGAATCAVHLGRHIQSIRRHAWLLGVMKPNLQLRPSVYLAVLTEECERAGIAVEHALSRSRKVVHCAPRCRAWERLYDMGYSYPQIAKCAGGRDHTSIIYGIRRIKGQPRNRATRKPRIKFRRILAAGCEPRRRRQMQLRAQ